MDNYPQTPPKMTRYRNLKGVENKGYLIGTLSSMSVYFNLETSKQEMGLVIVGE